MSQTALERQREALARAQQGRSTMNYGTVLDGFIDKGIDANDIIPRENVFTFAAWKAKGRKVKKGEHGVKVVTWIPTTKTLAPADGGPERIATESKMPRTVTVFHISQTDPTDAPKSAHASQHTTRKASATAQPSMF